MIVSLFPVNAIWVNSYAERWSRLFQWPLLVRRWYQGDELIEPELDIVHQLIAQWRERLYSISWLVRLLNESLAQFVGNPLAPVIVALAGVIILAAEKGPPDTAADHVVVRRIGEADLA